MRKSIFALLFVCASVAQAQRLHPLLFVTQTPIPYDFTAIGSVFGNHRADMQSTGRGGDLSQARRGQVAVGRVGQVA